MEKLEGNREILKKMYLFVLWLISKRTAHGYQIIRVLKDCGFKSAKASRLYPLLNMMLGEGLISQKENRHGKRIRKVYTLTAKGRRKIYEGKRHFFPGLVREFLREMIK